jgi:hypothetical protein
MEANNKEQTSKSKMEQQKEQPISKFEQIKFDFSYNLKNGIFEVDRMQNELIQDYIRIDQRFRRAFFLDKTSVFIDFLKDKARLKEPTNLSIMGQTRSGKSYCAISLAFLINYFYGRIMDGRYICANNMAYLEKLQEMEEADLNNSAFVLDESKGQFGIGSTAKKSRMTDVQNIIAKFNITTISLCPTKFSNSEGSVYGLRTMGRDFTQKVNRFMLYNLQEGEKGGIRPTSMIYIPIFTKLLPKHIAEPLEKEYNEKKDKWVIEETRGRGDALYVIKEKTARYFSKDEKYLQLKKKDEKIAYISMKLGSDWTVGEVKEIYNLTNLMIQNLMPDKE